MDQKKLPILCLIFVLSSVSSLPLADDYDEYEIRYSPIINLGHYGQVRGMIETVPSIHHWPSKNIEVFFYQAIRYGKAKRFERSEKADPWSGVYDAIEIRGACVQPSNEYDGSHNITEDCLYLNVWAPTNAIIDSDSLKPVMVWIHGGGFVTGSIFADVYDAGMLAANGDVIVVSIAYRLGPFGFLYTGDSEHDARGNQGLHDQILALQWIKENIHHFGGNPRQVTIFGESAGSMSVGSLILSPLAHGLFHRAIMQSGSPNSPIGSATKSQLSKKFFAFAKKVNCTSDQMNKMEILKCLRDKPMTDIAKQGSLDLDNVYLMQPIYGDDLMPISPVQALKTGKGVNHVDLMFGVNQNEVAIAVENILRNVSITVEQAKQIIRLYIKNETFTEQVVQFYTKHLNDSYSSQEDIRLAISDAVGDYNLVCTTEIFGSELSKRFHGKHYYSYRLMEPLVSIRGHSWVGVVHADDIAYIFGMPYRSLDIKFTDHERQLSRDMIIAWTQFAKNGRPGPMGQIEWHETRSESVQYMSLDSQDYHMVKGFFHETCDKFWRTKIFK